MDQLTSRALARADSAILPPDHFFAGLRRNGYPVIIADPPWIFGTRSVRGKGRSADRHYPTMELADIARLPVQDLAGDDCHLFLWITGALLAIGAHVPVMTAWGFKPSSLAFVWLKTKSAREVERAETWDDVFFTGMGFTTRQNAEAVILGRKGNARRVDRTIRQVVISPRREHSRKPDLVRNRIERYCGNTGVELFARSRAPGWDAFGNEIDKFAATA